MIKASIIYPAGADKRFDFDYYRNTHMPMAIARLSSHPGYQGVSVERGQSGGAPDSQPPFVAMCHFSFASIADFIDAFKPHAQELQSDIPNYTDIEPLMQFSSVEMS